MNNITITTDILSNLNDKPCRTCDTVPSKIIQKTRTISKVHGSSSACSSTSFYYCSERCIPDELPKSTSIAIAGERISNRDFLELLSRKIR